MVQNAASEAPSVVKVDQIVVLDERSDVRVALNVASEVPSVARAD